MEYRTGYFTISSGDVARLLGVVVRSCRHWIRVARQALPPTPCRFGYYSRLYRDMTTHELDTARLLLQQGQIRAAGAVAGVALEFHLRHVAAVHQVSVDKRTSIAQLQDALRFVGIVQPGHRKQLNRLTKIRNRCVHARKQLPTRSAVERLISGIDELRQSLV